MELSLHQCLLNLWLVCSVFFHFKHNLMNKQFIRLDFFFFLPGPRPGTEDRVETVASVKMYMWLLLLFIQFIKLFGEAKTYLEVSNTLQHYVCLCVLCGLIWFWNGTMKEPTTCRFFLCHQRLCLPMDLKCNLCSSLKWITFYLPLFIWVQREDNFNM